MFGQEVECGCVSLYLVIWDSDKNTVNDDNCCLNASGRSKFHRLLMQLKLLIIRASACGDGVCDRADRGLFLLLMTLTLEPNAKEMMRNRLE